MRMVLALKHSLVYTRGRVSRLYRVTLIYLNYTYDCNGL
jgi:catabolite regulation protein CreA